MLRTPLSVAGEAELWAWGSLCSRDAALAGGPGAGRSAPCRAASRAHLTCRAAVRAVPKPAWERGAPTAPAVLARPGRREQLSDVVGASGISPPSLYPALPHELLFSRAAQI